MAELLIEILSEEIPARMQARAAEDLKRLVSAGLAEAGLEPAGARAFATPRRLALVVEGLPAASPDRREQRRGPRVGAPERALDGFCRSAGVARADLRERETPKGAFWFATIERPGRPAAEIAGPVLERTIRDFPWPKSMRWGGGSLRWVRPIRALLCLLSDPRGSQVVTLDLDGIRAGDSTRGHRFMAPGPIRVRDFADYAARLERAFVMLDPAARAGHIRAETERLARARGLEPVADPQLLTEIAGLVEWPVVLSGEIDPEFARLPPEVLQTSMREHQKFLSLRDPQDGAIRGFVTVANIETPDRGAAILAGNRKVLSARLADAAFFWENDLAVARRDGMRPWLDRLEKVTFHNRLGSQGARIRRIVELAGELAPACGAAPEAARRAAGLAKADLACEMVQEFPELQGVMGGYYAREAGLDAATARAVRDHYAPLGPADAVPGTPLARAVALADKLDLLSGFWFIDERPSGSRDPFALRRAALGVIRILLAGELRLNLSRHVDRQIRRHAGSRPADEADRLPALRAALLGFFHERLKVHLKDEGLRHDVIDACLAMEGNDDLTLLVARARALGDFLATEDGANLLLAYRRAANILAQAETADGVEYSFGADPKHAEDASEKALFAALERASAATGAALEAEDFAAAMAAIARLRAPLDAFFEAVQINTGNQVLRRNRLNLLAQIRDLCLSVADLGRLEG